MWPSWVFGIFGPRNRFPIKKGHPKNEHFASSARSEGDQSDEHTCLQEPVQKRENSRASPHMVKDRHSLRLIIRARRSAKQVGTQAKGQLRQTSTRLGQRRASQRVAC